MLQPGAGACRREGRDKTEGSLEKLGLTLLLGHPYRGRILTGSHVTLSGYHM